jgi:glucose-1-phosphate adenylyltransferase
VDFGRELIPGSLESHQDFAHLFHGFWEDIGTVRAYFDVHMAMTTPNPPFSFHEANNVIYTHARNLPGVQLSDARISGAILCPGAVIGKADISNSVIGIRAVVRDGCTLNRVVMQGAERYEFEDGPGAPVRMGIGEGSCIEEAIIDHNAHIGRNVVIRGSSELPDYDGDQYAIRDGVVVVFKNGVIPDGAVIGKK